MVSLLVGASTRVAYASSNTFATDYVGAYNTLTGVYAFITAPSVSNAYYINNYAYFMLNAWICASGGCGVAYDFLQVGFWFYSSGIGVGQVKWTSALNYNSQPQPTGVSYVAGDQYDFSIEYESASQCWNVFIDDQTAGSSASFSTDCNIGLTYVDQTNVGSGVFLENANSNSNWYQGLGSISATYAMAQWSGNWNYWPIDYQGTFDCSGNLANNVISGSLVDGGSSYWSASGMPLAC